MSDHKLKILISDDEPMLVSALSRAARHAGFDAIGDTTSNVVSLAREHHPDVILLDVHQRVDGRDLLSRLKSDPETRDVTVIVLSGIEDQMMRRNCLELGAEDYAVKPFGPIFLNRVARLASRTAATA